MANISDGETNNENEQEEAENAAKHFRLNTIISVQGTDDRVNYEYGQPLAEACPCVCSRWGVSDFRLIVHRACRLILRKPTMEHDEELCRRFLEQALQQFDITEDANNMVFVIDTFIPDVYEACVYRAAVHQNLYGPWMTLLEMVEARSFLRTINDYLSGNLFDTLRVKRFGLEDATSITVDTVHAMTYGKGNDVCDAYKNRYVLVHWRLVHTVKQDEEQQSLQNQNILTWFSRFASGDTG